MSPDKADLVYKLIALCWNEPTFNLVTAYSSCHKDFANAINIGFNTVLIDRAYTIPTEKTDYNWLMDMQSKFACNIKNWELSRQREGLHVLEQKNDGGNTSDAAF